MDVMPGYVYVMINSSLNGIVKIGKTRHNPDERAKELSSATGVPTPFFVAYSSYFKDCSTAEAFVHALLANNRLAQNREFFRVSVQRAIAAVREAEDNLGTFKPQPSASQELNSKDYSTKPLAPWKVVFRSANAHFYGIGDTIEDRHEAFQLYMKAAKLGSMSAYWKLGIMYIMGWGCNQDFQKAKSIFLEGTKMGNDLCWAGLADIFYREAHEANWDKCWRNYFSSSFFLENKTLEEYDGADIFMSRKEWQMCSYINQVIWNRWEMMQQDLIYERRGEIGAFIIWYRMNSEDYEAFESVEKAIAKLSQERTK